MSKRQVNTGTDVMTRPNPTEVQANATHKIQDTNFDLSRRLTAQLLDLKNNQPTDENLAYDQPADENLEYYQLANQRLEMGDEILFETELAEDKGPLIKGVSPTNGSRRSSLTSHKDIIENFLDVTIANIGNLIDNLATLPNTGSDDGHDEEQKARKNRFVELQVKRANGSLRENGRNFLEKELQSDYELQAVDNSLVQKHPFYPLEQTNGRAHSSGSERQSHYPYSSKHSDSHERKKQRHLSQYESESPRRSSADFDEGERHFNGDIYKSPKHDIYKHRGNHADNPINNMTHLEDSEMQDQYVYQESPSPSKKRKHAKEKQKSPEYYDAPQAYNRSETVFEADPHSDHDLTTQPPTRKKSKHVSYGSLKSRRTSELQKQPPPVPLYQLSLNKYAQRVEQLKPMGFRILNKDDRRSSTSITENIEKPKTGLSKMLFWRN